MSCQPRTLNQAISFTRCYGAPCLVNHVLSTKQFPLQGVTGRRVLSTTYSQPSSFLYKVLRGAVSCQPRTLNQVVSFTRSYGAPCLVNHILSTKQFPLQGKYRLLLTTYSQPSSFHYRMLLKKVSCRLETELNQCSPQFASVMRQFYDYILGKTCYPGQFRPNQMVSFIVLIVQNIV